MRKASPNLGNQVIQHGKIKAGLIILESLAVALNFRIFYTCS